MLVENAMGIILRGLGATGRVNEGWEISFVICVFVQLWGHHTAWQEKGTVVKSQRTQDSS